VPWAVIRNEKVKQQRGWDAGEMKCGVLGDWVSIRRVHHSVNAGD